ncbi:SsgA family sporulation/cell division regulator [Streptomyces smyrnaeus]|uniref:SsgA family sporulation/cell division regulator n=1 Tax=Streptomyces smyrnaeus TaxID=1387713 RepID=UPI003674EA13
MSSTEKRPHSIALNTAQRPNSSMTGDWEISLVLSTRWEMPLRAHFTYQADDPYAAQLDFYLNARHSVRWTFARELLTTGTVRPAGHADVRVWPTDDGTQVRLCLESRQGKALFEIPLIPLSEWLERTYQLVPPGQEHRHLRLDKRLEHLLKETPYSSGTADLDRVDRPYEQADDATRNPRRR